MTILVVTRSDDHQGVQAVVDRVREQGVRAFRLDTDRFPTAATVALRCGTSDAPSVIVTGGDELDLADVTTVWYRRFDAGARLPQGMNPRHREAAMAECRATLLGLIAGLEVFHLDPLASLRRAGNKQRQLLLAGRLGLDVPSTLITNDPAAVSEFAAGCPAGIVAKMLSSFRVDGNDDGQVVFTSEVSESDLRDLAGLDLCPMIFQEKLAKSHELRVTLVGNRLFAASIDSRRVEDARVDWRGRAVVLAPHWRPYELPQDIQAPLVALTSELGLNYATADLILAPDGRHVFLELNPAGEFYWLEQFVGLPITDAIADVLLGRDVRVPVG